jgi:hypothetical protein
MSEHWIVHENDQGDWAEIPADDFAEMQRMALARGVSMSELLADAWAEFTNHHDFAQPRGETR